MLNHLLERCPNLSLSEHFLRVFFQTELSLISDATCSCTERSVNVRYITHQIYTVLLILLPICEWAFCVKFSLNWTLFFFFFFRQALLGCRTSWTCCTLGRIRRGRILSLYLTEYHSLSLPFPAMPQVWLHYIQMPQHWSLPSEF